MKKLDTHRTIESRAELFDALINLKRVTVVRATKENGRTENTHLHHHGGEVEHGRTSYRGETLEDIFKSIENFLTRFPSQFRVVIVDSGQPNEDGAIEAYVFGPKEQWPIDHLKMIGSNWEGIRKLLKELKE